MTIDWLALVKAAVINIVSYILLESLHRYYNISRGSFWVHSNLIVLVRLQGPLSVNTFGDLGRYRTNIGLADRNRGFALSV